MRRIEFLLCSTLVIGVCFAFSLFALAQTKQSPINKVILPSATITKLKPLVKKNLIFLTDYKTNNLTYLSTKDDKFYLQIFGFADATAAGKQFLKEYAKYFGSTNYAKELKLQKQSLDMLGTTHLVYQQYYKNIPVFGGQLLVHMANDFGIKSAGGKFFTNVWVNTKPTLNKTKAKNAALADAKKRGLQSPQIEDVGLVIYNKRVLNPKATNNYSLTWQIGLTDAVGWSEILFVDARTGKIVERLDRVKSIDFQMDNFSNLSNANDILFALYGGNQIQRRVYDCRPSGCTGSSTAAGVVITDPADRRSEGDPAYGTFNVDNIYERLGQAHNYYKDMFGLNGANGLGGIGKIGNERYPATSTIGYAYFIATSTWGNCPNAFGGKGSLKFCNNVTDLPLIGHEYTHAVSDFIGPPTTSLVYKNESGAIEEAIADILGQGVERYTNGASSWQIGESGNIWRDFSNPDNPSAKRVYPKTHYDTEFKCDAADNGGVHTNSMVVAHMGYLLSVGGELNGCKIESIGQEAIERLIFEALDHHLTVTANFNELYGALTDSCKDLYGMGSKECANLTKAMQAAQLDQPGKCAPGKGATPLCAKTLGNVNDYIWRSDNIQDVKFTRLISLPPVVDPIFNPVDDMVGNSATGIESGTGATDSADSNTTPVMPTAPTTPTTPATTPAPATPAVEEVVREPSFTVDVIQNNKFVTVNGKLNYYGKGSGCSGPRYFDPIIVRWGQVDSQPVLKSDNTFTASHEYNVKNTTYDLSVSVINSCFGSSSFHKTLTFPL